jgi:NAD-dependent dihydropyrimidine dehydrogenase PreA subunit
MEREIIRIDEEKCNGCGLCVPSCHEGALQVIDGKVRLVSELMCDGLGACIGHCPEGAITIEKREAEPYDEIAVIKEMVGKGHDTAITDLKHLMHHHEGGCPGSAERFIASAPVATTAAAEAPSQLTHWPVQMHLVNPNSQAYRSADLLLAADCIAFTLGSFHNSYLRGKALAIACPKLDHGTEVYIDKLVTMIDTARINTITVMVMEVPCCGGLMQLVKSAMARATRKVPVRKVMVSIGGKILQDEWI